MNSVNSRPVVAPGRHDVTGALVRQEGVERSFLGERIRQAVALIFLIPPLKFANEISLALLRAFLLPALTLQYHTPQKELIESLKRELARSKTETTIKDIHRTILGKTLLNSSVKTADGLMLRGWEFHHCESSPNPAEQKWVIQLNGNGGISLPPGDKSAPHPFVRMGHRVNILSLNYRGIALSDGPPPSKAEDYYLDGCAMVASLLRRGVKPENILIEGWSLGGGIGAAVTARYHQAGMHVRFISDRSFTTVAEVGFKSMIPTMIPQVLIYLGKAWLDALNYVKSSLVLTSLFFSATLVGGTLLFAITLVALSCLVLLSPFILYHLFQSNISATKALPHIQHSLMRVIYHVNDGVIRHPSVSLAGYIDRHPRFHDIQRIAIRRDLPYPEIDDIGGANHSGNYLRDPAASEKISQAVRELLNLGEPSTSYHFPPLV